MPRATLITCPICDHFWTQDGDFAEAQADGRLLIRCPKCDRIAWVDLEQDTEIDEE